MWYSHYSDDYVADSWPIEYRQNNANNIAYYFEDKGWTLNAICGMLGNMQVESLLNPAQWEHGYGVEGGPNHGYGLVQWTPWTKYTNWATQRGYDWRNTYNPQLERIQWELENGEQWQPVAWHGMTFREYSQSYDPVATLTEAFLKAYEAPQVYYLPTRVSNAEYWYQYFTGTPPTPPGPEPPGPGPTPTESSKFKLMFYLKPKWKKGF